MKVITFPFANLPPCEIADRHDRSSFLMAAFDLWRWNNDSTADNFTVLLYDLIAKADPINRAKIRVVYPVEVDCFTAWEQSPSEEAFFLKYAHIVKGEGPF